MLENQAVGVQTAQRPCRRNLFLVVVVFVSSSFAHLSCLWGLRGPAGRWHRAWKRTSQTWEISGKLHRLMSSVLRDTCQACALSLWLGAECTAVAVIHLRMRMRILTHPLRAQRLNKKSISIEIFNLDWKLPSRLKCSIPDLQNCPQKTRVFGGWLAWKFQSRLKISIPEGDLDFFSIFGPLGTPKFASEF